MRQISTAIFAAAALAVAGSLASSAHAALAYALTDDNSLLTFNTAAPTQLLGAVPLRTAANTAIQDLIGIDIRPSNGLIYGVGKFGTVYTINPTTGVATPGATLSADPADTTAPFAFITGSRFGFDFNPVPDRLRITSDADMNLRINVDTGLTTTDTTLNPANPNIIGSAYTNNFAGATTTTLYAIDSVTDTLYIQNPPNDGTLVSVGPLGIDVSSVGGFDIQTIGTVTGAGGVQQLAFAALQPVNQGVSSLYTINLATGAATLVGVIGGGDMIDGLTVVAIPEPATLGVIGGMVVTALRRRRAR